MIHSFSFWTMVFLFMPRGNLKTNPNADHDMDQGQGLCYSRKKKSTVQHSPCCFHEPKQLFGSLIACKPLTECIIAAKEGVCLKISRIPDLVLVHFFLWLLKQQTYAYFLESKSYWILWDSYDYTVCWMCTRKWLWKVLNNYIFLSLNLKVLSDSSETDISFHISPDSYCS